MNFTELRNMNFKEVTIDSPIGNLTVSAGRNFYNAIRSKYGRMAKEIERKFGEKYQKYSELRSMVNHVYGDFQEVMTEAITEVKKDLVSNNVIHYDNESIWNYAVEHGYIAPFEEEYQNLKEYIYSKDAELQANQEYRQERKDNRARWEGATFGGNLVDDVSHQLNMGARNLAEGLIHDGINAIGNKMDANAAKKDFERRFQDSQTYENLAVGCYSVACNMHLVLIDILEDETHTDEIEWISNEDAVLYKKLLNNIDDNMFDDEKVKEIYKEVISLFPYDTAIYASLFQRYGDSDGRVQKLAEYFDVSLAVVKDVEALRFVKEHQGTTEDDAKAAKEKLVEYCKSITLDVNDGLVCMRYINNLLEEFDLKYRTVWVRVATSVSTSESMAKIICETRDGADLARQEQPDLEAIMTKLYPPTDSSLMDYESNLLEQQKNIEDNFESELVSVCVSRISEYLADFEDKFCTVGLFKKLSRLEAGQHRALKYAKAKQIITIEDADKAKEDLMNMLPNFGLDEKQAYESIFYIVGKKKEITDRLDLEYRTVDGFVCETRESADLAREEVNEIHEFMKNIVPPTKESLIDYEEELLAQKQEFESTFQSDLKKKYLAQMDKYLKDFEGYFCNIGFMKTVDRDTAARERAMKFAKACKITSKEDAEKFCAELKEFLPKLGLTEEEGSDAIKYIMDKGEKAENKSGLFGLFKK